MFKNIAMFGAGVCVALLLALAVLPTMAKQSELEEGVIAERNFGSDDEPYMVPAAAFSPDGGEPESTDFSFAGGYIAGNSQAYGCVQTPVYFPKYAAPNRIFGSIYDNDDSLNITISLRKTEISTGVTTVVGTLTTNGLSSANGIRSINQEINGAGLTSSDYAYYLTTCLGSENLRLYSVRIYHTPETVYLPQVVKP